MCAGEVPPGQLVQAKRQALGEPAVVDENDGRAMSPHEIEDRRVDRRPDRTARLLDARTHLDAVGKRRHGKMSGRTQLTHVLDGNDDRKVELLARAGVHQVDLAPRAGDETADLLERALGRGEADSLERRVDKTFETFE